VSGGGLAAVVPVEASREIVLLEGDAVPTLKRFLVSAAAGLAPGSSVDGDTRVTMAERLAASPRPLRPSTEGALPAGEALPSLKRELSPRWARVAPGSSVDQEPVRSAAVNHER
jgi:hypothetical protein